MKEIRYKGELIATYDGEHTYMTEWAEELLEIFMSEPTSDERCKWIEIRSSKTWTFR